MTSTRRTMTLAQLSWSRRGLLAEALVLSRVAALAVKFLPFRHAVAFGARRLGPAVHPSVEDLRWAVSAIARRVPWRAMCFEQGLALQRMARRRGVDARLHYGIGKERDGELRAHVWVQVGDTIVIGDQGVADYREVAVYP